ncbi:MAG: type II secretion system protein GspC [Stenotrophobium sp.]
MSSWNSPGSRHDFPHPQVTQSSPNRQFRSLFRPFKRCFQMCAEVMMPPMLAISRPSGKTLALSYERYSRWIIPAVRVLLVIAVANVAAELVWSLIPVPAAGKWRPAPADTTSTTASNGLHLDTIIGARLFGLYQPQGTNLAAAPDTRLNLTLLGIFAGTRKEESRAVISQEGGDEKPFAIGDDVVKGATLQAIFPDRVILSRGGELETLRLDKDKPSSGSGFVAPAATDSAGNTAQLSQIRQQVLQDPNKAAEFIRVQPANVGGQMKGYRIYPGANPAIFNSAGLHAGDLVTAVNGIQLNDTQKALKMLNDLSQASSVSLVIDRGGQQQTINVSFN